MKVFVKILLVLNLLAAVYRNALFAPRDYATFNKGNFLFYLYKKQADNKLTHYFNYYLALTGFETGYRFYAPYVPDVVKIEFTIQSSSGNKTCSIALNTPEAKERFNTMGNHFYNPDVREMIARSLAAYMFRLFPDGQRIVVTAYAQPIPTPGEYLKGGHTLNPTVMASYSFNKT